MGMIAGRRLTLLCVFAIWIASGIVPVRAAVTLPPKRSPVEKIGARLIAPRKICGVYHYVGKRRVVFTANEKNLICGFKDVNAWRDIPYNQAKFHIRTFLQERAYYFPRFEKVGNKNLVYLGERTRVRKFEASGEKIPEFFKLKRKKRVINRLLTPSKVTEVGKWAAKVLNGHGYPCNQIETTADAREALIRVHLNPLGFRRFPEIAPPSVKGLKDATFRRYDAFKPGWPYEEKLLLLTASRTEDAGVAQYAGFVTECPGEVLKIKQEANLGKPRLIRVGFGANTEEYGIVKASWENNRLDTKASSLKTEAYASYRIQKLSAELNWYAFKPESRFYFSPYAAIERRDESTYEELTGTLNLTPAFGWESRHYGAQVKAGPQYSATQSIEGATRGFSSFLFFLTSLTAQSHAYEFFKASPQQGWYVNALVSLNHGDFLSDLSASQFKVFGQEYWNLGKFDPPIFILGVRGGVATTAANRGDPNFGKLPAVFFQHLGGSESLRGFKRDEVPLDAAGALTKAYASVEFRFANVIPWRIEPLVFADAGMTGRDAFELDLPAYWSPGFGLRWATPVGVVRGTVAHGFVSGVGAGGASPNEHPQFYVSFGEEF